jgi:choline dehydrogenase-like flavoprotein
VAAQRGTPEQRHHWKWSAHEYEQARHMQETFRALIADMGGEAWSPMPTKEQGYGIATGGRIIHELGCTRMGNDPASSVVSSNCQAHDCRNLFIADGGPFVSQADKNPTWTIMALAWRTSDYITEQRKAGAL